MRFTQLTVAVLLPLIALAAKKSSGDRFQDYNSMQLSTSAPLKLDDASHADLTKTPRDYSVAVLLTALEVRFGCGICQSFQPEWELLGKSWMKGDKKGDSKLVFGTLDFVDGKNTFQSVCDAGCEEIYAVGRLIIYSFNSKPLLSSFSTILQSDLTQRPTEFRLDMTSSRGTF